MTNQTEKEIIDSWENNGNLKVSICCITFNHENYIAEAIEGFLSQKTSFPFEILIRDDCSTDSTASIIREYYKRFPNIIFPVYEKENTYSKGIKPMPVLYKKARGEFIAVCEGDDYWTNPNKLAMQVDFLEKNPNYSLCGTKFQYTDGTANEMTRTGHISHADIVLANRFGTQTVMFRSEFLDDTYLSVTKEIPIGDWPLWMYLTASKDAFILDEITAAYRLHQGGIFSPLSDLSRQIISLDVLVKIHHSKISNTIDSSLLKRSWRLNLNKTIRQRNESFQALKVVISKSPFLDRWEKKLLLLSTNTPFFVTKKLSYIVLKSLDKFNRI